MPDGRRLRLLAKLQHDGAVLDARRLCEVGASVTGTSGAGIMLMAGEIPRGSLCTTDEVSALIEELQFTLGEGPCIDAYQHDRPVGEIDLASPAQVRWPAFTPPAVDGGVRAVFGFPLRVGEARLGALDLYRDAPGPLSDEQHADALVLAGIVTRAVLDLQAAAPLGEVAQQLELDADFHFVVHQASGMVAAQLGTSIVHALIRLRAYAFAHGRPLSEVAEDVVERTLRFDDAADAADADGRAPRAGPPAAGSPGDTDGDAERPRT